MALLGMDQEQEPIVLYRVRLQSGRRKKCIGNQYISLNIAPAELTKYMIFSVLGLLYWAYIFPYCPVEDSGITALRIHQRVHHSSLPPWITRTHQIWPRISLCAIWYEGILNVDIFEGWTLLAQPAGKTLGLSAHWVICRQGQAGPSVRMHLVKANVMPYQTVTPQIHHNLFGLIIFGQLNTLKLIWVFTILTWLTKLYWMIAH